MFTARKILVPFAMVASVGLLSLTNSNNNGPTFAFAFAFVAPVDTQASNDLFSDYYDTPNFIQKDCDDT